MYVGLCRDGISETRTIHRIVAAAFLGPRPPGHDINHRDGDKTRNCVSNLEYVLPAENMTHASQHGLLARGEQHWGRKLSPPQVQAIRSEVAAGASQASVARRHGVSPMTVSRIVRGLRWKHVAADAPPAELCA